MKQVSKIIMCCLNLVGLSLFAFAQNASIYKGGNGDGWASKSYAQATVSIFKGGKGDGWASLLKPYGPLSATLVNFTARRQGNNATLVQWRTFSPMNTPYFDVERSNDAVNFALIGKIDAAVSSSSISDYNFTDHQPFKGINYYRLKHTTAEGEIVYTPIRLVNFDDTKNASIKYYPNPSNGILNIEITKQMQQEAMVINISNAAGIIVEQIKHSSNASTKLMIDMKRLAKGIYFVQVKTDTSNSIQQIVLQ